MSLIIQVALVERYGPRLNLERLAEALGIEVSTARNKVWRGVLGVLTYKDGRSIFADVRDVAAYLDQCRERARAEAQDIRVRIDSARAIREARS